MIENHGKDVLFIPLITLSIELFIYTSIIFSIAYNNSICMLWLHRRYATPICSYHEYLNLGAAAETLHSFH